MFPTAKKKPDMSIILGIGKKGPNEEAPPSPFGKPKAPTPADEPPAEEIPGENEAGEGIPPEAVSYRTAAQQCQSCEYMGEDGNCSKLMMPVEPDSGCNLHSPKGGGEDMGAGAEMPTGEQVPA